MEIFSTKLGKYFYVLDNSGIQKLNNFDYSEYELVKKKYFHSSYNNTLGVRALYFFLFGSYNEDVLLKKYKLNSELTNKIRIIQKYHNNDIEDFSSIPELLLDDFAKVYLELIVNLHQDLRNKFNDVDVESLRIFDRSKVALKRLTLNNPFMILKNDFKKFEKFIYKIGRFNFLQVKYSNEMVHNGLIMSYDRSLNNIAKDDQLRNMMVSRFGRNNGSILTMDYNAFHPRIIFSLVGYNAEYKNDFYSELIKDIKLNVDRNKLKVEIFKSIYSGCSEKTIINKLYPNIVQFDKKIKEEYNNNKFIKTITGRRRYFNEGDYSDTKVLNSYIQMMHADIINEMLCKLDNYLINRRSRIIGLIADNFIIDVHKSENESIKDFCVNNLQKSRYFNNCFFKLNFSEGNSWAQVSPIQI